ncbi:MAG: FimV/HubP family polar landmark protein [SAR86 cluster bacterium]|nr:FimV/HubP family polar landmark protein [SAR86 cluster bacterium]
MKNFFILLALFIPIAQAKGIIGSPEVSINTSGNYLISIQINNLPLLNENDIELNDFKSNDPLSETALEYLLFEDMDVFKRLTLALPVNFQDTYFSFRLRAGNQTSKDIFIFLPQNTLKEQSPRELSFKLPAKKIYGKPQRYDIQAAIAGESDTGFIEPAQSSQLSSKPDETIPSLPSLALSPKAVKSENIETMWSVAQSVRDNYDASIYQIMWAFYLENPNAFIDENINLVRNDVDLVMPSSDLVMSTENNDARQSINFMSSLPSKSATISGRQLILTAPEKPQIKLEEIGKSDALNLDDKASEILDTSVNKNSNLSGSEIIEKNTSIISLSASEANLTEVSTSSSRAFQLKDLIWVALLSLILGFVIAFVLIRLNRKPSFTKTAVEDEFQQDDSTIFQSNLSITNDIETQELDLVRTYIDMNDWKNAEMILEKLLSSSTNPSILSAAKELLDQKK